MPIKKQKLILMILFCGSLFFIGLNSHAIVNKKPIKDNSLYFDTALLLITNEKQKNHQIQDKDLSGFSVCSGVYIQENIILTAGHCISEENNFIYIAKRVSAGFVIKEAISFYTEYSQEPTDGVPQETTCSERIKPLPETKTVDLALVKTKSGNIKNKTIHINNNFMPKSEMNLEYYGYGSNLNPFDGGYINIMTPKPFLRKGTSKIWRKSPERIGFLGPVLGPFASVGDSGGPVLFNNQLIGIINTISEKCETEFGEDYAILNTATLLSTNKSKSFIKNGLKKLN